MYSRPDYKSDGVIVFGAQWENTDLHRGLAGLTEAWDSQYAYPKLRFAGVAEAMKHIAGQLGNGIPTLRGDGGSYWESSLAWHPFYTALARENEQRVLTAEKFSTIASFVNSGVRPDRVALRRLWQNLILFDSHTWDGGGENPDSPLRVLLSKSVVATMSARLLEQVLMRGMAAIADSIYDPAQTLIVFNPLNWPRSDLVKLDLAKGRELVDLTTKQKVPYEILSENQRFRRIAFMASEVPAVGYKCYAIEQTQVEVQPPAAETTNVLESPFYRIVLDPASGAVRSIFDKELDRELVSSSSAYRFDEPLFVTGKESEATLIGLSPRIAPPSPLEIRKAGKGRIVSITKTPFGAVARLESSVGGSCAMETEIILLNGHKKIEFVNRVPKNCSPSEGSVYFAFPFAMQDPQFRYEIQNGVVDPAREMLPGGGLEVFSVQHWVSVQQGGVTAALIPVDAPLVTLGDINRHAWPTEFGRRPATIFSYAAQNVGAAERAHTLTFRYVLRSGRSLSDRALSRYGWQELTPLETDVIIPDDKVDNPPRPLDAASGSFLQIDAPDVVFVTWKLAQDGKGTILRFLEVGGESRTVNVTIPILDIAAAWRCNAVEANQRPLPVSPHGFSFDVKPHEIVTVRLSSTPAGHRAAGD
ncbi:MAG: hypothetical protein M1423_08890, partial [Acidobacteria bacterium]|nr:hypothetical protein [Acidobacteriota bacterium]